MSRVSSDKGVDKSLALPSFSIFIYFSFAYFVFFSPYWSFTIQDCVIIRGKGALIRVYHLTIFTFFLFSPPVLFYALAMDRQAGLIRITQEHLVAALRETRPSVSASERQQYDRMYVNFQGEKAEKEWKITNKGPICQY
jgi:hypothetical protein